MSPCWLEKEMKGLRTCTEFLRPESGTGLSRSAVSYKSEETGVMGSSVLNYRCGRRDVELAGTDAMAER